MATLRKMLGGGSYDESVALVTSESNTSENWALVMDFCDKIGREDAAGAQEAVRALQRRLGHRLPIVQIQTIALISSCVSNCGRTFHLALCSRDFVTELKRLLNPKTSTLHPTAKTKLTAALVAWETEFSGDPQLSLIHITVDELRRAGVDFPTSTTPASSTGRATTSTATTTATTSIPAALASSVQMKEDQELARAIEESLKYAQPAAPASSMYPSLPSAGPTPMATTSASSTAKASVNRKAKALYDFEAKEDNELSFRQGDIVTVLDDSDSNWWKGVDQDGHQGYFPCSFVSFDLSAPPPEPVKPAPPPVVVDGRVLDDLLQRFAAYVPGDERAADLAAIVELEKTAAAMTPLIDAKLAAQTRAHDDLAALNKRFEDALALFQRLSAERSVLRAPAAYAPPPSAAVAPYANGGHARPAPEYAPAPAASSTAQYPPQYVAGMTRAAPPATAMPTMPPVAAAPASYPSYPTPGGPTLAPAYPPAGPTPTPAAYPPPPAAQPVASYPPPQAHGAYPPSPAAQSAAYPPPPAAQPRYAYPPDAGVDPGYAPPVARPGPPPPAAVPVAIPPGYQRVPVAMPMGVGAPPSGVDAMYPPAPYGAPRMAPPPVQDPMAMFGSHAYPQAS